MNFATLINLLKQSPTGARFLGLAGPVAGIAAPVAGIALLAYYFWRKREIRKELENIMKDILHKTERKAVDASEKILKKYRHKPNKMRKELKKLIEKFVDEVKAKMREEIDKLNENENKLIIKLLDKLVFISLKKERKNIYEKIMRNYASSR